MSSSRSGHCNLPLRRKKQKVLETEKTCPFKLVKKEGQRTRSEKGRPNSQKYWHQILRED